MDIIDIPTLQKPVNARVEIPGSKSYTNRALIMAALTKGPVTLCNPLYSQDTEAMIDCLRKLGVRIETTPDQLVVFDDVSAIDNQHYELFAKDSGTTLRFLLALACLTPGTKVIRGNAGLNERPIQDLVDSLRLLGAKIDYLEKEGHSPLKISSSSLSSGSSVKINSAVSSQYLSALLMIAPLLNGLDIYLEESLISKPYIEMTIDAMAQWGVNVARVKEGIYHIPKGQHYVKKEAVIEGDFSSAGYFFAIGALTQSTITLKNLNFSSIQADRHFLTILERMGNEINTNQDGITIKGKQIIPLNLEMEDCPDQVQTMAVLAAFAKGVTKIKGVRSLRVKETERVKALRNELAKMGIKTEETHDTLTIYGGNPKGATIETYGDHRMAMAFAVAGTQIPGVKIRNPEVVNKTFPTFWGILNSILIQA